MRSLPDRNPRRAEGWDLREADRPNRGRGEIYQGKDRFLIVVDGSSRRERSGHDEASEFPRFFGSCGQSKSFKRYKECGGSATVCLSDREEGIPGQQGKFVATLASKPQPYQQGTDGQHQDVGSQSQHNPPVPLVSRSSCLDACTAVDVDCNSSSDIALPMVEGEMDNSDLKEVAMEDLTIETIPSIDICDSNDPLAVVEYVEDIYSFYRQTEVTSCVSPDYMSQQFDINEKMRAILVDWLIEVHYKFELMEETLFLTVNIIDRFLARQTVARKKLQLAGVTAMLLACKYEEVSVPVVEDLILISDRAYTREEVLDMVILLFSASAADCWEGFVFSMMERLIVNTLQFNMSVPTAYVFMRRFLKAAEADKKVKTFLFGLGLELNQNANLHKNDMGSDGRIVQNPQLELLSFFIVELCLVEYKMLEFRPSLLAAAAIYTAQCSLRGLRHWTKTSEMHSNYSEDQLLECSRLMVDIHHKAGLGKLTGVHRKYSTFKYGCTAKAEPALFFLLNTDL
ncbi:hypothetical protein MUK42_18201 [Musa troglodytarum]|uniref:Cyclin N-terminal domain-containing protein n=1 Tax=Musa troglodytarum TaxID=320322 RepID=A0A9E7KR44_9LILI|nr:hypothetical protein MUK42_18201 [Musa troglodytarum]